MHWNLALGSSHLALVSRLSLLIPDCWILDSRSLILLYFNFKFRIPCWMFPVRDGLRRNIQFLYPLYLLCKKSTENYIDLLT